MRKLMVRILTACALAITAQGAIAQTVSGTATYRERIAPPPDARFEAVLLDVSRMDVAAAELGRTVIAPAGAPPYAFEIAFDQDDIDPAHSYAVRATLFAGDRMMFTTDTNVPVLTRGAPDNVDIVMVRATGNAADAGPETKAAYGLTLPASFAGRLSCADCEGVEYHLDLWPDQAFHLRRTWVGGPKDNMSESDLGLWSAMPGRSAIRLWGLDDSPARWRVVDTQTLEQLGTDGTDGTEAAAESKGRLTGDGTLNPADLQDLFLGGMMTYMADAAMFTECATGHSYPIAQEADYLALERAYLEQTARPGAPLYVHVMGDLAERPAMEGPDRQSLVVDRFIRTRPGITCERQRAQASLTDTYWRIDSLFGKALDPVPDTREAHIVLTDQGEGTRYAATVGCNQLNGGYTAEGDTLTLAAGPTTLMACPPPLASAERRLTEALQATGSYAVSGETLTLRDGAGKIIAVMTATYMR